MAQNLGSIGFLLTSLAVASVTLSACSSDGVGLEDVDTDGPTRPGSGSDDGTAGAATGDDGAATGDDGAAGAATGDEDPTAESAVLGFHADCGSGELYYDDFSSRPDQRWATVAGTFFHASDAGTYTASSLGAHAIAWVGPRDVWRDYAVEARLRIDAGVGNAGLVFRLMDAGTPLGNVPNDGGQMYYAGINAANGLVQTGTMNNGWTELARTNTGVELGRYYTLRVEVTADELRVLIDGAEMHRVTSSQWGFGSVGVRAFDVIATYDEVRVECPGTAAR